MNDSRQNRTADSTPDRRTKILFVDADPVNTEYFLTSFQEEYDILASGSGEEALAIFSRDRDIALVLSDQRIGAMSGVDLLSKIYTMRPETVRIIITGYMDVSDIIDAINKGHIYQYVLKPWDIVQLRLILDQADQTWRLTRENRLLSSRLRENEQLLVRAKQQLQNSRQQLCTFSAALITNQEDERERIATKLREDLGQSLTGLKLQIKLLEDEITRQGGLSAGLINGNLKLMRGFLNEIIENIRLLSMDLSPVMINELGLDAAVENLIHEFGRKHHLPCSVAGVRLDPLFSGPCRRLIYRLIQETLHTFIRLRRPHGLEIQFKTTSKNVILILKAPGPTPSVGEMFGGQATAGNPLMGTVTERVSMLGGTVDLAAGSEGEGAMVVTIPIGATADFGTCVEN